MIKHRRQSSDWYYKLVLRQSMFRSYKYPGQWQAGNKEATTTSVDGIAIGFRFCFVMIEIGRLHARAGDR